MTKVRQLANNQFEIENGEQRIFQSYSSIIAIKEIGKPTLLSEHYNYSKTTTKYLNQFLGHDRKETEARLKSGEYIMGISTNGELINDNQRNG